MRSGEAGPKIGQPPWGKAFYEVLLESDKNFSKREEYESNFKDERVVKVKKPRRTILPLISRWATKIIMVGHVARNDGFRFGLLDVAETMKAIYGVLMAGSGALA